MEAADLAHCGGRIANQRLGRFARVGGAPAGREGERHERDDAGAVHVASVPGGAAPEMSPARLGGEPDSGRRDTAMCSALVRWVASLGKSSSFMVLADWPVRCDLGHSWLSGLRR